MHLASTLDGGLDFSIWRYCAALYSTRQQYGGSEENHIVLFHAVHSLAPPVSNAKLSPFCPRTTQKQSKRAKRKRTERNANALRNQAVTDFARLSDFAVLDPKADVLPIRRSRNCCKHLVYIMPQQLLEGQSGQTPNLGGVGNVRFRPYRLFNSRGHDPNNAHFACTACHDPYIELTSEASSHDANCTGCHAAVSTDANPVVAREQTSANTPIKPATVSTSGKPGLVANERCVTCHMPKVELPGAHYKFTDHRIRIARPGDPYPY